MQPVAHIFKQDHIDFPYIVEVCTGEVDDTNTEIVLTWLCVSLAEARNACYHAGIEITHEEQ